MHGCVTTARGQSPRAVCTCGYPRVHFNDTGWGVLIGL